MTSDDDAPLHMRIWRVLPIPVIRDMDFAMPWGRANPGERWACLCGGLFGWSYMVPLWRVRDDQH